MTIPARLCEAMHNFGAESADSPVFAKAPARVNIIGEHSDYNDGFVLPTSTAIFTWVAASSRADRIVRVKSYNVDELRTFDLDNLAHGETVGWVEYVKGVAAELEEFGVHLRGADILVDSNIPLGAGLSSSASLELSIAFALLGIVGQQVPAPELAKLCQRAERRYAGVQCGIMDQYTLACADFGHAILLDCRSLDTIQIAVPADVSFILTDSGVRHRLSEGDLNRRASECMAAVKVIAKAAPDVKQLRDLHPEVLEAQKKALGDVLYRRCRHVVTEIKRVRRMVQALENCDLKQIGSLLSACHDSLRKDFEVSCDELDALVVAANASDSVYGSRMVGAGFGGCVLSVADSGNVVEAAQQIRENYTAVSGKEPWQHIVEPAEPAGVVNGA